ncbi:LOW QUALITY PROTEIN: hypothetical protein M513_10737, partial [Trichuris suis]
MNKSTGGYLVPGNCLMGIPVSEQMIADMLPRVGLDDSAPNTWDTLLFHPTVYDKACQAQATASPELAAVLIQALNKVGFDRLTHLKPRFQKNGRNLIPRDPEADLLYNIMKDLSPSIFDSSNTVGLLSQDDRGTNDKRFCGDETKVAPVCKPTLHSLGRTPPVSSVSFSFGCSKIVMLTASFPEQQQEPLRAASPARAALLKKRENTCLDYNSSAMEEAVRQRIVSIGKQPKACARKKKDLVSELFDSLTPASQYFAEGSRRSRAAPKSYSEEELAQLHHTTLCQVIYDQYESDIDDELLPSEAFPPVTVSKPKEEEETDIPVVDERPPTPREVIEEREREWSEILKRKKEKLRLRGTSKATVDVAELAENESYQRFLSLMDNVFELPEEIELAPEAAANEEDVPPECLISRLLLSDLCSEMAKLKAIDALHRIPVERLCKLIAVLDRNVKDGIKFAPSLWTAIEQGDCVSREIIDDHVQRSCDAAHAITILMSSAFMPKQIYIEDTIETVTTFTRTILQSVVYPVFDPQYRPAKETSNANDDGAKGANVQAKNVKRAKAPAVKDRVVLHIYSRIAETISDLGELVNIQTLTDTCILQLSALGVSAFFVENLGDLQLSSLRLLSNIFANYERHRQLILEDILTSVYRLPSIKRGLRTYRLTGETSIQMVTALIMQLIQSVICVALNTQERNYFDELENRLINIDTERPKSAEDVSTAVLSSYETAVSTAHGFLTVYLKKCTTKSDEDYRPLFEDFIKDLLEALNRPEWPSAELLLKLLATVLVKHFANKQNEITMRVASLDYLGMIAASIRRDSMLAVQDAKMVNEMVARLSRDKLTDPFEVFTRPSGVDDEGTVTVLILQKALNFYLANLSNRNNSIEIARRSHIAQWFRDVTNDLEKTMAVGKGDQNATADDLGSKAVDDHKRFQEAFQKASVAKEYLYSLVNIDEDVFAYVRLRREDFLLTEQQAYIVVRYLALRRPLMQSFDYYLGQILRTLGDTAVAIRTKGMKCLSSSVEVDPDLLFSGNIQVTIMSKLHDQSSNVREAAVELIGKLLSVRPESVELFYQVLTDRLLDTGISVRKRTIRILKEVCERRPDFEKISEIYSRILRRASDEESIVKLVADTFHALWFSPSRDRNSESLMSKVVSIIDVVAILCKEGFAFDSMEMIFRTILKKDADGSALQAAKQIVSCLVENVMVIEERLVDSSNSKSYQRLLFCLSTIYVFSKVEPRLMVPYIETMQPYLSMHCTNVGENSVLNQVMKIVEMVVPLIEHPNIAFLKQIEEALSSLITKSIASVVQAAISCLAVIVPLTKDYSVVVDIFNKFRNILEKVQSQCDEESSTLPCPPTFRPAILRALFTLGLVCRYFDIDSLLPVDNSTKSTWKDQVFRQLLFFACRDADDVRARAIAGLGSFCIGHPDCLLQKELTDFYLQVLTSTGSMGKFRVQVLRNLEMFLIEEEQKMLQSYAQWEKNRASENLKEMGESTSGLSSTVIQSYLRAVLDCFYSMSCEVRKTACEVIVRTLQQGLIHPGQCMPCVIAMTTDPVEEIRSSSSSILKEIDSKYAGFVQMKSMEGMRQSYRLHFVLQGQKRQPVRGFTETNGVCHASNSLLYTVMRNNKQHRRCFLRSLLQLFDEVGKTSLLELIYIADNLATFPYQTIDEPLFIIHNIDLIISVTGSTLLQNFQSLLLPTSSNDEEEEETVESVMERLPAHTHAMKECIDTSQGIVVLLMLNQYLKESFAITDAKLQEYSPNESSKQYDKSTSRRNVGPFQPRYALEYVEKQSAGELPSGYDSQWLCKLYIDFKQLMMSFDISTTFEESSAGAASKQPFCGSSDEATPVLDEDSNSKCVAAFDEQHLAGSSSSSSQQRIVLTIHRVDNKKAENTFADVMRSSRTPVSGFSVSLGSKLSNSGKKKRKNNTDGKKTRKRKVSVLSDSESDSSYSVGLDDSNYYASLLLGCNEAKQEALKPFGSNLCFR